MSRDFALYFSNKLSSEWSASSVTGLLSSAIVEDISSPQKWEALDPLVRVRLLLAAMFLRRNELTDLRSALINLKAVAINDPDEWVRIIAAAVGSYDGILHMDAVVAQSTLVKATLEETKRHGATADPSLYRPLEEMYLSAAVMEKRLPGSIAKQNSIPPHSHFRLREPSQAPGAAPAAAAPAPTSRPTSAGPSASSAGAKGTAGSIPGFRSSTGIAGKPPIGPPRPGGRAKLEESSLFMNKKPGGGLLARLSGTSATAGGGGSRFAAAKQKKKAAVLDINAVAELNQVAAAEREKKQQEEAREREAALQAKLEAKKAEKEAKEERKKREAARLAAAAAAAKEAAKAEKETEKQKKEAEAKAAKEAREAAKAAKEAEIKAAKEEAARKKAEEQAGKEIQKARREAEKAQRAELKRQAAAASGRPAKVARTNVNAGPSALATMQSMLDSSVLEQGAPGEAPLVQLIDQEVALAALREAENMEYYQGEDDEDYDDPELQRYIAMGQMGVQQQEEDGGEDDGGDGGGS